MTAGGGAVFPRRRIRVKTRVDVSTAGSDVASAPSSAASSAAPVPGSRVAAPCWNGFLCKERHEEYAIVKEGLTPDMLQRLERFLSKKRPKPAQMKNENNGDSDDERKARYDDRDSLVSWFSAVEECPWLHDRLATVVRDVANAEWPLLKVDAKGEVLCEYEATQYTVYGPKQHFAAWHQDAFEDGNDAEDARQFSLVVMLTHKNAYTGGYFQAKLRDGKAKKKVVRNLRLDGGDILVFPAKKLLHHVCAVKTGIRKTLVFWAFDKTSCKFHAASGGAASAAGSGILARR